MINERSLLISLILINLSNKEKKSKIIPYLTFSPPKLRISLDIPGASHIYRKFYHINLMAKLHHKFKKK